MLAVLQECGQALGIPAGRLRPLRLQTCLVERCHRRGSRSVAPSPALQLSFARSLPARCLNHPLPLCQASSLFEVNESKLSVVSLLIRKRSE